MTTSPSLPDYPAFLAALKERILRARISAARAVNHELILLYWDIGRGILEKQRTAGWGDAVVERLAADLRAAFPSIRGFSAGNLWRMRQFYQLHNEPEFLAQIAREIGPIPMGTTQGEFLAQAVREMAASVPWGHHVLMLGRLTDPAARLYYLRATAHFGWSRNVLLNQMKAGAYQRAVLEKKTHNFELALPEHLLEQADEMLKSSYNLEFLGIRRSVKERELEDRLVSRLQQFILELGYLLKQGLPCALLLALMSAVSVPKAPAAEVPKEPLPVNVFRNLQVGKPQTVAVYGTSLSHTAEWPRALDRYFRQEFPGLVQFTNVASSGQQSEWGVANLKSRVLSKKPDLVFIEFSVNDAATRHHISTEKSVANLDAMVKALRGQNPRMDIVLQTMNPAWDSPDEPSHKKYASARPHLADYYEAYRKYAHEQGLPLVDNYPNWLKLQQTDEAKFKRWLPEGLHPIPEASLAVTWPAVEALLERARRAAAAQ